MNTSHEGLYRIVWSQINTLLSYLQKKVSPSASVEEKNRAHKYFIQQINAINIPLIEQENHLSFKYWLINEYHDTPDVLVGGLYTLELAQYDFKAQLANETPMLEHICSKPKAIEILTWMFHRLKQKSYELVRQKPPFAIPTLSKKLFSYLIDNFHYYMPGDYPIFWALGNSNLAVFERIIRVKPECLYLTNILCETPLMIAIRNQREDFLLKILNANPTSDYINACNTKNETITHIACQTDNFDWLNQLLYDERFKELRLFEKMTDLALIDHREQIALCHAVIYGHTKLVNRFISSNPELKNNLYLTYFTGIQLKINHVFPVLFDDLGLTFDENPNSVISFVIDAVIVNNEVALNWILSKPLMNEHFKKATIIYNQLERKNYSSLKLEDFTSINWPEVPYQICFNITLSCINHKIPLIHQFDLFSIHPHFHSFVCTTTHVKNSFLSMHPLKFFKYEADFKTYFLNYLQRNQAQYPGWLSEFGPDLLSLIDALTIDKNSQIQDAPLLFFVENYCYEHFRDMHREDTLKKFLCPDVHINNKNVHGHHLFAHLLMSHAKGAFQRIQMLKKINGKFSLEHLDLNDSNLLHIAIEMQNEEILSWAINQGIDLYASRSSDGLSALQLILDSRNIKMFDILRRQIKKSNFLSFINTLITQKKDELLEYLFAQERPFSWIFTEHHIKDLKTIPHEVIQERFNPLPQKKEVVTLSHQLIIDAEQILLWIERQQHKQFDSLLQPKYQEPLKEIFKEKFLEILHAVFSSPCKNLNKTFIRIPAVKELTQQKTWQDLCLHAISNNNLQIFENLIAREAILTTLRTQTKDYYRFAMQHHIHFWSEHLIKHLPMSLEDRQHLFEYALTLENDSALAFFLNNEQLHTVFTNSNSLQWYQIILKASLFDKLCKIPKIFKALKYQSIDIYHIALEKKDNVVQQRILSNITIRQFFVEKYPFKIEENLELWALYPEFDEIWHHLMLQTIKQQNIKQCENLLNHPTVSIFLKNRHFDYYQAIMLEQPNVCTRSICQYLPISMKEKQQLFEWGLYSSNPHALDILLFDEQWHPLLIDATPNIWMHIVLEKTVFFHQLITNPPLMQTWRSQSSHCYLQALEEKQLSMQKKLISIAEVRHDLIERGYEHIESLFQQGFSQEILLIWSPYPEFNEIWHHLFLQTIKQQNIHQFEQMLSHPTILSFLTTRILDYYQLALLTHPTFWYPYLKAHLPLNKNDVKTLFDWGLHAKAPYALDMFLFDEQYHILFNHASPAIWMQIILEKTMLFHQLIDCPQIQQAFIFQAPDCYLQALRERQPFIQQIMLSIAEVRQYFYQQGKSYFQALIQQGFANDIIPMWLQYPELQVFTTPYFPVWIVVLPTYIRTAFMISYFGQTHLYLVGSAIHCLLGEYPDEKLNDMDFISSSPPALERGYAQSKVQPKLFFTSIPFGHRSLKLEYFVKEIDGDDFISKDYLSRDFTVNALYCDVQGRLFDPTNCGLDDLKKRLIRSIQDAKSAFESDPIRLLRVIRLILKKFNLTPEVRDAIYHWQPQENMPYGHIFSMANTMLSSQEGRDVFKKLKKFHLLTKLFAYHGNESYEEVQSFVKDEAHRFKYSSPRK